MKKILFLLIISLLFISCWYESDYIGALINDDDDTNHIILTVSKRENTNTLNNIIISQYLFKNTEELQTPLKMSDVQLIKNATNIFDKDYITTLDYKEATKYFYIEAKITSNNIYIKDWDNKKHNLKLINDTNSWLYTLYRYHAAYNLAKKHNITNQKDFEEFFK